MNFIFLSFGKCTEEQNELLKLENNHLKQIVNDLTEKIFGLAEENQELIIENKELVDELNGIENECTENLKRFNKTFELCEKSFTKCKKEDDKDCENSNAIDEDFEETQTEIDNLFKTHVDSFIKQKESIPHSKPKPISHEHIKLNNVNFNIKNELFEITWQADPKRVEIFATDFILQGSNDPFSFNKTRPLQICVLTFEKWIAYEGSLYFTQERNLRKNTHTYYRIKIKKNNEISYSNTVRIRKY